MYGQLVRDKRKEMNMTQAQFADRCGLHPSTIAFIEQGRSNATFQTRQMIDKVLYPNKKEKEPYGIRLHNKRKAEGLTQLQLAAIVHSSPATLSSIEKGHRHPPVSLHVRLKAVLGEI